MPLSGPASYVPTISEFRSFWQVVDGSSGTPLLITDPRNPTGPRLGVAVMTTLYEALDAHAAEVSDCETELDYRQMRLAEARREAVAAAQEFQRKVRADGRLQHLARRLTTLPAATYGEGPFMKGMNAVRLRWKTAESLLGAPFPLTSGETHAGFRTRVAALDAAFEAAEEADLLWALARMRRDETQALARAVLASFRTAMEGEFLPEDPLLVSLPRIYPLAGHTPDAVALHAAWEAENSRAKLTWPASADADLSHYEVRASHHARRYSTEDERVLGRVEKGAAREFFTTDGLAAPGATGRYKVYVVLTTGNERGSAEAAVTRPG